MYRAKFICLSKTANTGHFDIGQRFVWSDESGYEHSHSKSVVPHFVMTFIRDRPRDKKMESRRSGLSFVEIPGLTVPGNVISVTENIH